MSGPGALTPDPLAHIRSLGTIECGADAAKHFALDEGYVNLNHGSYGTYPIEVRTVFRHYQERIEARPDGFTRFEYRTHLLDRSRAVIEKYLDAPPETCVFVPNTSNGVDTVLRNLVYEPGDVIVRLATLYQSYVDTTVYLAETTPVEIAQVQYTFPISDDDLVSAFETTLKNVRAQGKTPKVAIFDTITSIPGIRLPFQRLTELCRSNQVLSLIDGAHGVGQIPLSLRTLDPDFFISNCHKWLHVPRGCAVFYVPVRNQHLLRATLPIGFGFVSQAKAAAEVAAEEAGKPAAPATKSSFVANFSDIGTRDNTPYLCVEAAIEWRSKLTWNEKRGEEAVMGYILDLAQRGGQAVAKALETELLDNAEHTATQCSLPNVRLPLPYKDLTSGQPARVEAICQWLLKTLTLEYQMPMYIFPYAGAFWSRMSAQVYLTLQDFERAGGALVEVCARVRQGEWEGGKK